MKLLLIIFSTIGLVHLQGLPPNAGSSVSPKLIKCYNNSFLLQPNNRLPATIEVLIALIRKIEDNNPFVDNREISSLLLHNYRQDGITKSLRGDLPSQYGIPYSPKRWDAYRNLVLLKNFIPDVKIYEDSYLSDLEMCSLHFLISKTVDTKARGDEMSVCNQLGKYTMRSKRNSFAEPVEQFGNGLEVLSQCPVEYGVVYTKWGAVYAGSVLSGIAGGFFKQKMPLNKTTLDSRYATTIAGDLAEAALYQILPQDATIKIGADGSWNSTLEPKWYFIQQNQYLQVTDAEIRGGLDGLYLGLSIDKIKQKFPKIKVSQILDLYYSRRGLFDSELRACNRKKAETTFVNSDELIKQTGLFETLLDPAATLDSSIDPLKYQELASYAVDSFNKYIPNNLQDPDCSSNGTIFRASTDISIILDLSWPYNDIHPMISYLLENIDVNDYESSYSIINAKNGEVLVNKSRSILDFHDSYNRKIHEQQPTGIDYNKCLESIESSIVKKLNSNNVTHINSQIFLMVPYTLPNSYQQSYAEIKLNEMKKSYPDFRILILGPGQKESFKEYLINPDRDFIVVPDTKNLNAIGAETKLKTTVIELIDRIKDIPRPVVNPSCGTSFGANQQNSFSLIDFVEPEGENLYRIQPNYFYNKEGSSRLVVRGQGYGSLDVCVTQTRNSPTNPPKSCKSINSDEISLNLNDYCKDETFEECDPLYISVKGGINSYTKCSDAGCRFPDNIKFLIVLENVKCFKNHGRILLSSSVLLILSLLLRYFN